MIPIWNKIKGQATNIAYQINDALDAFSNVISKLLPKDGSEPMTGNLDMNGKQILNVDGIFVTGTSGNIASADALNQAVDAASTSANDAHLWATSPEDSRVTDSQGKSGYSALHYSDKAEQHANSAQVSASNAATSEANALSYLNDFKGRYYGAYSSDPATDPLGNPVDTGDVYYNTTENKLKYWTGSAWGYWSQDADTLDGYHASYFATATDLTSHTSNTNNPHNVTAAQLGATNILEQIKTVDGSSSGLDADTVDGFDTSQTPAPNVIVPLDANGALDLSVTYVRSNVYTFRRVDLTNTTSDYMLQVGEEAYISFSNTTSVPLRIATQSGTYYECHLVCSNPGGTSGGVNADVYLNPNNTTYSGSFGYSEVFQIASRLGGSYATTLSAFRCGRAVASSVFYITNFTQYKNVKGIYDIYRISNTYPSVTTFSADWRDTTTPWNSIGTITFPQLTSGYVLVRRLV
jgi:hypothetical protein